MYTGLFQWVRQYFRVKLSFVVCTETRKQLTEAPMPGYRGYIPRVRTTELGLGTRYHDMTKNGLDSFYTARYEREKKYGPLPDTFGAQRHQPTTIKRLFAAETAVIIQPSRRFT